MSYCEAISSENRYKLYLDIAELFFKRNDVRYKSYIEQAFQTAKKNCAPGTGCNKTLRLIYNTVLRWKNLSPDQTIPGDNTYIEDNRYRYITYGTLKMY